MHPSPSAETSKPLFPNVRVFMIATSQSRVLEDWCQQPAALSVLIEALRPLTAGRPVTSS
jgi:hypothetical protein